VATGRAVGMARMATTDVGTGRAVRDGWDGVQQHCHIDFMSISDQFRITLRVFSFSMPTSVYRPHRNLSSISFPLA